jgi:hypothetical protein
MNIACYNSAIIECNISKLQGLIIIIIIIISKCNFDRHCELRIALQGLFAAEARSTGGCFHNCAFCAPLWLNPATCQIRYINNMSDSSHATCQIWFNRPVDLL